MPHPALSRNTNAPYFRFTQRSVSAFGEPCRDDAMTGSPGTHPATLVIIVLPGRCVQFEPDLPVYGQEHGDNGRI